MDNAFASIGCGLLAICLIISVVAFGVGGAAAFTSPEAFIDSVLFLPRYAIATIGGLISGIVVIAFLFLLASAK